MILNSTKYNYIGQLLFPIIDRALNLRLREGIEFDRKVLLSIDSETIVYIDEGTFHGL